ncbi:MAG: glycosyltransferase family 4 protein [Myxococcota bacterium]
MADGQKKHITLIVSNVSDIRQFDWVTDPILAEDYRFSFVLLNVQAGAFEREVQMLGLSLLSIRYRGKRDLLNAIASMTRFFVQAKPDIVHAHLLDASLAGLIAACLVRVRHRIYTRHHSNLHYESHCHGILYDRLVNWMATRVVATCANGRRFLVNSEGLSSKKITTLPFGINANDYQQIAPSRIRRLSAYYQIDSLWPVVGMVSRYEKYKGIEYVVGAFKKLLNIYPNACLVIANAKGRDSESIKKNLKTLPALSYREIDFESDMYALYQLFDVFAHVPVDPVCEAFGQVYIESLLAGIPAIFTMSGIAPEFVKHGKNALVVPFCDSDAIFNSLCRILQDSALANRLKTQGQEDVARQFSKVSMIQNLKQLYQTC